MNTEQKTGLDGEHSDELSLMDLFLLIFRNWYWFVLSITVCVGLAVVYLKVTPKLYVRTASVLIKSDSKGGGTGEMAAFDDLSLYSGKRNVENEVILFKAHQLMMEVARRLHLDVTYHVEAKLRMIDLYKQSPVTVAFPEAGEMESFSFQVTPVNEKQVKLSGFSIGGEQGGTEFSLLANLNDTISTPVGQVVVNPTLYYTDYRGMLIHISKSNLTKVAQGFRGGLEVKPTERNTTILDLTFSDVSIARAEDVLNTLIEVYNEDAVNDKNQIVVNTSNFINERLQIIEDELKAVDTDIEVYKKMNKLTDITSEAGMYLGNTNQYDNERMTLETQLSLSHFIRDYLLNPQKHSELIPSNTGISNVGIESQIQEYNTLLLRRDKLLRYSGVNNPVVTDLNHALGGMRQTIIRTVDNQISGLEMQLNAIQEREGRTAIQISSVPTQQKYVLSVERQQKIKEELYLYLLNKREENALTQAITESNARIIDPAMGSDAPIQPKSTIVLMAAFILGCVIPGAGLWIFMASDTKVHSRREVEAVVKIPFLGEIPLRAKKDRSEISVREHNRDSVSEAFRIIRTNLDFMRIKSKEMQVVMFTSLNPDAGKTFVSVNLSMSIALTQKKIVLLDADIRKATLTRTYITDAQKGLTHYLSGNTNSIDEIIYPSGLHDQLDVIASGPIPPNPAELLLSERLEQLIAVLRKRYDYIIIDNVPAMMVADAVIVSRVADLTVYVIRADRMDRRQLPDLQKLYEDQKFNNLSVILNGIRTDHKGYGYGYGYGYE